MRSPQTIGVDPRQRGHRQFHMMFSVRVHFTGRFFSVLIPLREGPRHWGQVSARTDTTLHARITAMSARVCDAYVRFWCHGS
jgi:hypothetical protein